MIICHYECYVKEVPEWLLEKQEILFINDQNVSFFKFKTFEQQIWPAVMKWTFFSRFTLLYLRSFILGKRFNFV